MRAEDARTALHADLVQAFQDAEVVAPEIAFRDDGQWDTATPGEAQRMAEVDDIRSGYDC